MLEERTFWARTSPFRRCLGYDEPVRTFSLRTLREFWESGHPDAELGLRGWYSKTVKADWNSFAELRDTFRNADLVGDRVVFNIKRNEYRLIAYVNYDYKQVLIKFIGSHADYSRLSRRDIENL